MKQTNLIKHNGIQNVINTRSLDIETWCHKHIFFDSEICGILAINNVFHYLLNLVPISQHIQQHSQNIKIISFITNMTTSLCLMTDLSH